MLELSSGSLYFEDIDTPVTVRECDEDLERRIMSVQNPISITIHDVDISKDWTIVKCGTCGLGFPVTKFFSLIYGVNGWTCPGCTYCKAVRRNING